MLILKEKEEIYNLSLEKVPLGLYEIVSSSAVFSVGSKVLVINLHPELQHEEEYLNYVVYLKTNKLYVDCPITVKKVLDKIYS